MAQGYVPQSLQDWHAAKASCESARQVMHKRRAVGATGFSKTDIRKEGSATFCFEVDETFDFAAEGRRCRGSRERDPSPVSAMRCAGGRTDVLLVLSLMPVRSDGGSGVMRDQNDPSPAGDGALSLRC